MYHLKSLIKAGLVQKTTAGAYALSAAGRLYVDRADKDNLNLMPQARIGALIVCSHPERGLLYARRNIQPAHGYVGFPIIDLPLGFPLPMVDYANDVFSKMLGTDVKLRHRADGYINLVHDEELHGSLLAHILMDEIKPDIQPPSNQMYDFIWEQDMKTADNIKLLKSNSKIIEELASNKDFFYFEQTFDLGS